jgi:glycerol kinase
MQMQADVLGAPVIRGKNLETTGIGAAFLAGLGTGVWKNKDELRSSISIDREFNPRENNQAGYLAWQEAVRKVRS